MIIRSIIFPCFLLCIALTGYSQQRPSAVLSFDFNEQQFKEADDKVAIKAVGVVLVEDRFGNARSAAYLHGSASSYINLGTSELLKPRNGSISMWVNLQEIVYWGKGYTSNPFIIIKNGPGEDFVIGRGISYSFRNRRLESHACKDSLISVSVHAQDTAAFNTWYHLVATSGDDYYAFYINGVLQDRLRKGFISTFSKEDSVLVGRTTGTKNERFTQAIFDDIRFYDKVLTPEEVLALYEEPNPNRVKNILSQTLKYGGIIAILGIIIVILIIRNKRNLKKQKEYYELNTRIKELELKVIRTQMNPHFISNSMAAIQNLILTGQTGKAGHYLAQFSLFLRQVLNYSDQTYNTLEQELELIKLNVELEQLRFKENFTFRINADKSIDLSDIMIPSLITQPFVENAIWHGLLPLGERDPHLEISVYLKNDVVFLEIEDNGVGRQGLENKTKKNSRGTRLAMDKVQSTNELRNSNDYKLEIVDLFNSHNQASGTKVIIQLLNYTPEE